MSFKLVDVLHHLHSSSELYRGAHSRRQYRFWQHPQPPHNIPPFDREGLLSALNRLYTQSVGVQSLLRGIHDINDACFSRATHLSLVLFDENRQHLELYEAKTPEQITRSKEDWGISPKGSPEQSIADLALNSKPGSLFHFQISTPRVNFVDFHIVPPDYADRLLIPDEAKRTEVRLAEYQRFPNNLNLSLLRRDNNSGPDGHGSFRSAILAPLWHDNRLMGAMLIGYDYVDAFTASGQLLLGDHNLLDLQNFINVVSLTLGEKLRAPL